jgi:hypothetical protein
MSEQFGATKFGLDAGEMLLLLQVACEDEGRLQPGRLGAS